MVVHASQLFELEVVKDALNADTFVEWEGCRRFWRSVTILVVIVEAWSPDACNLNFVAPILTIPAVPSKTAPTAL